MIFISKKRFEAEVQKKVDEVTRKIEEHHWREERERNRDRFIGELENRVIECEKKCGIDHPSHHRGDNCHAAW